MNDYPIYLDNQATTAVDPLVMEAMIPLFCEQYGNPASKSHTFGRQATVLVDIARAQIAKLIGAAAEEIVFTSGATESINLALKGAASMYGSRGRHIITTTVDHRATLDTCKALEQEGFEVTYLPVDHHGLLKPESLASALRPDTIIVSILHANNEIGTIQPLSELAAVCQNHPCLFHVDGAQSVGKLAISVDAHSIDLLSFSSHKIYGPKGVGALYVRAKKPKVQLRAQIHGGGHEHGFRSGTLPAPLVVGFGTACNLAATRMDDENISLKRLRDHLVEELTSNLDKISLNGHPTQRLSGNASITFHGVNGARLMKRLPNLALSRGSACSTEDPEPSHVLRAIGVSDKDSESTLRFGIGRFNTKAEIDQAIGDLIGAVLKLRASPIL